MAEVQVYGSIPIELEQMGPRGAKGWTPVFSIVADGVRRVIAVDWQGGAAPKPAVGYLGTTGVVATKAEAADVAYSDVITAANDVAVKYPAILNAAVQAAASAEEAGDLVNQAAEIVFAGSTDFPLQPPLSYWHCDMGEIEPTIDLTYTGLLSVFDRQGVLRSVPAAARALNYDPVTKECLGFPLWEGRTNYISASNDGQYPTRLTALLDSSMKNPAGGNAWKCITDGQTDPYVIRSSNTVGDPSNRTFTFSVWLWTPISIGPTKALLYIYGATGAEQVGSLSVNVTSTPTRFSITKTFGPGMVNTLLSGRFDPFEGDTARGSNTPNAGLEMYFYGLQIEEGFLSPYIPTIAAIASRGSMLPQIAGLAFQRDFGLTEGTIVLEFLKDTSNTKIVTLANLYDTSGTRALWLEISTSNGMAFRSGNNHGLVVLPAGGAPAVVNGRNKVAFSYKAERMTFCLNGGTVFTSNSLLLPLPLNRFDFCLVGYILNNHVRERISYNYVVDDAHLVALSRL